MAGVSQALLLLSLFCTASLMQALKVADKPVDEQLAATDACKCLSWQDAGDDVDCAGVDDAVTCEFFGALPDEKFCMNENFRLEVPKQFCYVSDSCEIGTTTEWNYSRSLKFKWCHMEESLLGFKMPLELKAWTTKHDLDLGLVVHFAYPTFPRRLGTDVLEFFDLKPPADADLFKLNQTGLTPDLRVQMEMAVADFKEKGIPTLIVSQSGHPPFAIMEGMKLYWLNFSEEEMEVVKMNPFGFMEHPGIMNDVKCVAGCDEVVAPWMSEINKKLR